MRCSSAQFFPLCTHTHCLQLFSLSKSEALAIDPQQRLLLEETHSALLDGERGWQGHWFGSEAGENWEPAQRPDCGSCMESETPGCIAGACLHVPVRSSTPPQQRLRL